MPILLFLKIKKKERKMTCKSQKEKLPADHGQQP